MKSTADRPFADPEKAARKLLEIANTVELVQDGRIYIDLLNGPFLFSHSGSPAEFGAGMKLAIERGWLTMHERGAFVRFTQSGAEGPVQGGAALNVDVERPVAGADMSA